MFLRREVVAQLVELLLPTPESSSSNPVIGKKICELYRKDRRGIARLENECLQMRPKVCSK